MMIAQSSIPCNSQVRSSSDNAQFCVHVPVFFWKD